MFEYQIEYTNGKKSAWIQWDRLDIALSEAEFLCVRTGLDKIKGLVFRRIEGDIFRFRPDRVLFIRKPVARRAKRA